MTNLNSSASNDNLIGEREVAARLGVTVAAIRKWRLQRSGPPFAKLGATVRYAPSAVSAWVEARTRAA